MLYITFEEKPNMIEYQSDVFYGAYFDDWFDDPYVKKMVLDIDKSEVISANSIISPVLGNISVDRLSSGVKGLILLYKWDEAKKNVFQSAKFGDNCFPWILEIAKSKDITLYINSFFEMPQDPNYIVTCIDDGKQYIGYKEIFNRLVDGRAGDPDYDV